jgi:hypothetical protein
MTTQPPPDLGIGLFAVDADMDLLTLVEVNTSGRGVRSRSTTTDSSATRRRNVLIEIPAPAAASASVTPRATAVNAGATTDLGILAAPIQHLPDQELSRSPLEPALDIENVGDQIGHFRRLGPLALCFKSQRTCAHGHRTPRPRRTDR